MLKLILTRDVFNSYGKGDYCILEAMYTTKEYPSLWNEGECKRPGNSTSIPVYLLCHFCNLNKHSYFIWKSLQLF